MLRKLAFGSIKIYLFGVAAWYKDKSLGAFDPVGSYLVQQTMAGARNILRDVPKPKLAFHLAFFQLFHPKMDFTSYVDIRDWAAFLLGFFGLFRKAELLALQWGHIGEIQGGIRITIAASKTAKRSVSVHVAARSDEFCPLSALKALRNSLPDNLRKDSFPVFATSSKNSISNKPLSGSAFSKRIKKWIEFIGLDASDYSGHSLRRGGATALHNAGVTPVDIQLHGRWVSECWKLYATRTSAQLMAISASI